MSMIYCGACALLIDSDDDPGCFIGDDPYYEVEHEVLCETCREAYVREDMKIDKETEGACRQERDRLKAINAELVAVINLLVIYIQAAADNGCAPDLRPGTYWSVAMERARAGLANAEPSSQ